MTHFRCLCLPSGSLDGRSLTILQRRLTVVAEVTPSDRNNKDRLIAEARSDEREGVGWKRERKGCREELGGKGVIGRRDTNERHGGRGGKMEEVGGEEQMKEVGRRAEDILC